MPEEKKQELKEYYKQRYHNMSEEKKQELKEYHKQRYQKQKSLKNNDLWLLCICLFKYYKYKIGLAL